MESPIKMDDLESPMKMISTPPKFFQRKFPLKNGGKTEDDPASYWDFGDFSGANC